MIKLDYKDYYKILGVDKKAGDKEIKSSYRKLVKRYHPDKTKGDKRAEDRFKEIAEAYEVLSDSEKRQKYDELGANWDRFSPGDNWQKANTNFYGYSGGARQGNHQFYSNVGDQGTDFSEFFNAFFGGADGMNGAGFGGSTRRNVSFAGRDVETEIRLSVEEAYNGISAQVSVQGSVLKIKVPPGVKDGQKIRVTGKGERGERGAKSGDLYLVVRINDHKLYKLEDTDIKVSVPISPSEAALGAKIQVPTPKGKISLSVPPGTSSGKVLRLKGMGLGNDKEKGNLLVKLEVVISTELTAEEKELYKQLQEINKFNPREKLL